MRPAAVEAAVAFVFEEGAGVVVEESGGDTVLESNSIQKLFTAGAALLALGAGHRYRTPVLRHGDDLVLVASGDPTFSGEDLARLCRAVADAGVRRVGAVVVDDTRYDRLVSVPGWKDYYVPGFIGPLSAFVLDRNRHRRDEAFVADPVAANAERAVDALRAAGVQVRDGWRIGTAPDDAVVVAEHVSPSLGDIVCEAVRASDTFTAELLTKELGAAVRGEGSTAAGLAVIEEVAACLGTPRAPGAVAGDGSGLAASTTDTARRQVAWLRAMDATAVAADFRRCLPVAGRSGTLAERLSAMPGVVAAKTGTRRLHATANLAGYATTRAGHEMRFAVTVTGAASLEEAVAAVDDMVEGLVER